MADSKRKTSTKKRTVSSRQQDQDRIAYLASLIDHISEALISTDLEFKVLEWNQAAESMYGWTAVEVVGHPLPEFIRYEFPQISGADVIKEVQEQGIWKGESTQNRKDGTRFPALVSVSVVRDERGDPTGFLAIHHDITGLKRVEEQLRQTEERFSKAFHSTPTALVLARLSDSKFEYVNESFLKMTGYQIEEVIEKSPTELTLFPKPEQVAKVREILIETGMVRNLETMIRLKSGELRQVLFSVDIIQLDQQPYSLTTIVDITARVQAEQKVVQMKRLYATLSQVNQTIVRVKDHADLYRSICDVAMQFGEFSVAWIGLLEQTSGDILPVAATPLNVDHWPLPLVNIHRGPLSEGLVATAIREDRVTVNNDVQKELPVPIIRDQFKQFDFHAAAAVPFRLRGVVMGALILISREPGLFQNEGEVKLLEEMGLDISFALDTLENEKERRQANQKVERQNQRLRVLREIDIAILAAHSVEEIVGAALNHVRELLDCYRANLILLDSETNELVMFEVKTTGETAIPKGMRFPFAPYSDNFKILSQNQPLSHNDFRMIADPTPGVQGLLKDGLLSMCSLPLFSRGSLIGAFSAYSELPAFFDEEKINLTREIANQVAIALTQYRLVEGLRESEEKYRAFFENSLDAILLTSPDGSIQAANPAACKMFGRTEAELCALNRAELVDTKDPRLNVLLEERDRTGKTFGELTMFRQDGSRFPVEMSSALFRDRQGNTRTSMMIRDITERKQVEEQLSYQAHLLENVNDAIVASDANYVLRAWNQAAEKMYGWTAEEMLGRKGVQILQTQFLNVDAEEMRKHIAEVGYYRGEATQLRKDGKRIPVEVVSTVLHDDQGRITDYVSVNRDITERKQAEEQLRQSEKKFSDAFHQSPAAMSITRIADGMFADVNEVFLQTFGFARNEVIGHTSTELSILDLEARRTLIEQQMASGGLRNAELEARSKSGKTIHLLFSSSPIDINHEAHHITTMIDITERKKAEEHIKYQAALLEHVSDAIVAIDMNSRITSWNAAATAIYGWRPEEVLGESVNAILQTEYEDNHSTEQAFHQLMEEGFWRGEVTQLRKDHERISVLAAVSLVRDIFGNLTAMVAVNRDITERKKAEVSLQRQIQRLNALRTIDTAISSSFDQSLVLDVVLGETAAQLGVDACTILLFNRSLQTFEYAASYGFHSNALRHTHLKAGEGYAGQAILERKTVHISSLMETGGKLASALQMEAETFVEYYGTPLIAKGEVIGVLEIYHRSYLKVDDEWLGFLQTLAGQAAIAIDNARLFEELERSNANLERRVVTRTLELNQTNFELERANHAKDEFLATMSHELRTPLNSILGLSESLLEQRRGPLNEHQQNSLQIIASSGQHLLELINDILDLSKIDAGKFEYYPQAISVEEICRSSLAFVKGQAFKKSITLTYTDQSPVSRIFADPRRLKQILVNLLNNAVKFTPENGRVTLEVGCDTAQELIHFSVVDTGIGIAAQDLSRLFQPFVQVDSQLNRQYEGTGLGLALVQRLTDLQGGSVEVESKVGQGSRFTIRLPCRQEEIETPEAQATQAVPPPTDIQAKARTEEPRGVILLAEDSPTNILTLSDYLDSYGYQVVIAHNGAEAIEQATTANPDLILMDIQMPVLDGLEAIRRLRAMERFASLPIIALTALAMPGDRERCLAAGASDYLSKPVSLKTLRERITGLLKK